jgi:cyclophilin family peptidyl-prolyl cis-trans isomerase
MKIKTSTKSNKILAVLLCAAMTVAGMLTFTGCSGSDKLTGNMTDIGDTQPGDIYAEIRFRDFEGVLMFKLFGDVAPVAVEEFAKAAESGYYDNKTLHRVLKDVLVQGGALNFDGSDAAVSELSEQLLFDVETHSNARPFYGALAFAVDEETGKNFRQFFIVTAKSVDVDAERDKLREILDSATDEQLSADDRKMFEGLYSDYKNIPAAAKERYKELGGLPLLDGKVTVFGQLIVTDSELLRNIAAVDVVAGNRIDDENPALRNGKGQFSRPADDLFISSVRIIRIPKEGEDGYVETPQLEDFAVTDEEVQIVGMWISDYDDDENNYMEFFADGRVNYMGENAQWSISGNQLTVTLDGESSTLPFSVVGDTLMLYGGGFAATYTRIV